MQSSKKILITSTGILLAILVSSLIVLRNNVQSINSERTGTIHLTAVPVNEFKVIHFSGKWVAQLKQGRAYKVEVGFDERGAYLPQIENRNDTLFFSIKGDSLAVVEAKVITPFLKGLKAEKGADIKLKKFDLDSLTISLDQSHLIGQENKLFYTSYETTGNSTLEFIDDPFQ